jgi:hypothetical protein
MEFKEFLANRLLDKCPYLNHRMSGISINSVVDGSHFLFRTHYALREICALFRFLLGPDEIPPRAPQNCTDRASTVDYYCFRSHEFAHEFTTVFSLAIAIFWLGIFCSCRLTIQQLHIPALLLLSSIALFPTTQSSTMKTSTARISFIVLSALAVVASASPEHRPGDVERHQHPDNRDFYSLGGTARRNGTVDNNSTDTPSSSPSESPLPPPTSYPSAHPSVAPSRHPSDAPTPVPSSFPTQRKTTPSPHHGIFSSLFGKPDTTKAPASSPSSHPSSVPSSVPSAKPSTFPSVFPSSPPSVAPSEVPIAAPTKVTASPHHGIFSSLFGKPDTTKAPASSPSSHPSSVPSTTPVTFPSVFPSSRPSVAPSEVPIAAPSSLPSHTPVRATGGNHPGSIFGPYAASNGAGTVGTPVTSPIAGAPAASPIATLVSTPTSLPSSMPSTIPSVSPIEFPSSAPAESASASPSTKLQSVVAKGYTIDANIMKKSLDLPGDISGNVVDCGMADSIDSCNVVEPSICFAVRGGTKFGVMANYAQMSKCLALVVYNSKTVKDRKTGMEVETTGNINGSLGNVGDLVTIPVWDVSYNQGVAIIKSATQVTLTQTKETSGYPRKGKITTVVADDDVLERRLQASALAESDDTQASRPNLRGRR